VTGLNPVASTIFLKSASPHFTKNRL
jgi:hypothetical protein